MTGLALPLSAEDNRPIKDAAGQIVSIPQHAAAFAHAVNMHRKMVATLVTLQIPIMTFIAMCPDRSNSKANAQRTLEQIKEIIAEADAGAKLPPAEEVGEQAITAAMADWLDEEETLTTIEYAKAIKDKFRVYSR